MRRIRRIGKIGSWCWLLFGLSSCVEWAGGARGGAPIQPPPKHEIPDCGNGIVESGEECDPLNNDMCDPECIWIKNFFCGNLQPDAGEQCEPPGTSDCNEECQIPVGPLCGDGVVWWNEECDPPDGEACDAFCRVIEPNCGIAAQFEDEVCEVECAEWDPDCFVCDTITTPNDEFTVCYPVGCSHRYPYAAFGIYDYWVTVCRDDPLE